MSLRGCGSQPDGLSRPSCTRRQCHPSRGWPDPKARPRCARGGRGSAPCRRSSDPRLARMGTSVGRPPRCHCGRWSGSKCAGTQRSTATRCQRSPHLAVAVTTVVAAVAVVAAPVAAAPAVAPAVATAVVVVTTTAVVAEASTGPNCSLATQQSRQTQRIGCLHRQQESSRCRSESVYLRHMIRCTIPSCPIFPRSLAGTGPYCSLVTQ
jgi:hypothetical protein